MNRWFDPAIFNFGCFGFDAEQDNEIASVLRRIEGSTDMRHKSLPD